MALADLAAYKAGLSAPRALRRYKALSVTQFGGGLWDTAWKNAPDAPTNPIGALSNLDGSTVGSLFPSIPASGTPRLAQIEGTMGGLAGVCLLCDRLAHIGGLVGNVTIAQTVGVGPNSRVGSPYPNVMAAVEIYTNIGTTGTTVTASYTNDAGTAGQTSPAITLGATNNREAARFIQLPLAAGDSAVKSVESVTINTTSTGTAGNFGITLFRPIALFGTNARGFNFLWDGIVGGCGNLPDVTNICAFLVYFGIGNTVGDCVMDLRFLDT